MNTSFIPRDERTTAVENESFRWGYLFQAYGLLLIVAYRGFVLGEASWDLLVLVVLGGAITALYQARQRVLSGRCALAALVTMLIAGVLAAVLVVVR